MDLIDFFRHTSQLFFRLSSSRFLLPRSTIPSRNLSNTSLTEVNFFERKFQRMKNEIKILPVSVFFHLSYSEVTSEKF